MLMIFFILTNCRQKAFKFQQSGNIQYLMKDGLQLFCKRWRSTFAIPYNNSKKSYSPLDTNWYNWEINRMPISLLYEAFEI